MSKTDTAHQEVFLTVEDAAGLLKVSKKMLYREIENGKLKVHRFGRVIRLSRSNLAEYLNKSQT